MLLRLVLSLSLLQHSKLTHLLWSLVPLKVPHWQSWPILLVITAAIFVYNLVVHTKAMETIKTMLSSVTSDTRVLALLLAWGFGAFMEGMAGFGTAVAIPAAMMVAGFDPLKSIIACSLQTPYQQHLVLSVPTTTLASLTNPDQTI